MARSPSTPPGRIRALGARHALSAAVAAGGALGALGRLGLDVLLPVAPGRWPWATFTANLVACALLGYLATRLLERLPPSTYRRPLLGTGLCGALSTFSALQVEAITLGRDGHGALAAAYVATSIVAGLALMAVTTASVRRATVRPR
jgi:CrcB protein